MSTSYDIDHESEDSKVAILAIIARINGEFDNPNLKQFGPLGDTMDDVLKIAKSVGLDEDYEDEPSSGPRM